MTMYCSDGDEESGSTFTTLCSTSCGPRVETVIKAEPWLVLRKLKIE